MGWGTVRNVVGTGAHTGGLAVLSVVTNWAPCTSRTKYSEVVWAFAESERRACVVLESLSVTMMAAAMAADDHGHDDEHHEQLHQGETGVVWFVTIHPVTELTW